jgi:hypothetical protein
MSLASFYPVHEAAANSYCTVPLPTQTIDPETGLVKQTLNQILMDGYNRVYIDNTNAVYSDIVAAEAANSAKSPFTSDGNPINWNGNTPHVAVVGGGMSGLLTAYQLKKAGMTVTLFEAGSKPTNGSIGAGRIAPTIVSGGGQSATGQLGAMRFPSNAYLFWHYMKISGAAGGNDTFTAFPNVGKVPTTFTGGDPGTSGDEVKGIWNTGQTHSPASQKELPAAFQTISEKHAERFSHYSPPGTSLTVQDVADMIECGLTPSYQTQVDTFWTAAVNELYHRSYHDFLSDSAFNIGGYNFTADRIKKVGYIGIGTGGFGPLFSRCVLEIIRLFIWRYDTEFAVPNLGDLPKKLYDKCKAAGVYFQYDTQFKSFVYDEDRGSYIIRYSSNGLISTSGWRDYIVLAMTSQASQDLLANAQANFPVSRINNYTQNYIFPFYDNRSAYSGFSSDIKRDLEGQDGMDSVKIFQTMSGPASGDTGANYLQVDPNNTAYDALIKTCFGNANENAPGYAPLGLTYVFPVHNNTSATGPLLPFKDATTSVALHYNWGSDDYGQNFWPNDAANIQANLLNNDASVQSALNSTGKFFGSSSSAFNLGNNIWKAIRSRFSGFSAWTGFNAGLWAPFTWFFKKNNNILNFAIVRWSKVPFIKMGFKLDRPSYGANLIYAYKVNTESYTYNYVWDMKFYGNYYVHPAVKKVYFAGDAVSNYGGWVEGAFQSALNTSAGIIQQAAQAEFGGSWTSKVDTTNINNLVQNAPDPYSY